VVNKRVRTGYLAWNRAVNCRTVRSMSNFTSRSHTHFRYSLLNPDTTSAEIEAITEQYLHHDVYIPDRHAEPSIISISRHVSECINAGLTSS